MRIVPATPVPSKATPVSPRARQPSPTAIVCAALLLALVFLTFQIGGVLGSAAFPDCSFIGDSVEAGCPIP